MRTLAVINSKGGVGKTTFEELGDDPEYKVPF